MMFKLVAEQGSIIRASQILHCVPSNITNRIKLLENELGTSLFIRKGRGLVISPSGELFLDYTNKILSLCHEARRALDSGSTPSGILKIGAIESSATGRLPGLLSQYHHRYPLVQIQLTTGTWLQLQNDVVAHKLDGAIIAVNSGHPDIEYMEIYEESLVFITAATAEAITTPQDLDGTNIFMWPEGCPYRKSLESWLAAHDISATLTSIASYGTILGCVSCGAGISLVPKGVFDQFKSMGSLQGHAFDDLTPIKNYFIWNNKIKLHHAKDKFAELLKNNLNVL